MTTTLRLSRWGPHMEALLDAEELLILARLDIKRGAPADALLKLKQAVQSQQPPNAVYVELARLYAQLGLRRKAEPLYNRYLEMTPSDVDALFQLGMVQFEEGRRDDAWSRWEQVLKVVPSYPPAHFFRAVILADAGRREESLTILKNLLVAIEPDNLYVERAKDLIGRLSRTSSAPGTESATPLAGNAYKSSH